MVGNKNSMPMIFSESHRVTEECKKRKERKELQEYNWETPDGSSEEYWAMNVSLTQLIKVYEDLKRSYTDVYDKKEK